MNKQDIANLAWDKMQDILPAIIQDSENQQVLMLGYMTREALQTTMDTGMVTFYSRSKQRLWTKGESSGHFLKCQSIQYDCDADSLLIQAQAMGPTCHLGTDSCFKQAPKNPTAFINSLEQLIQDRKANPKQNSYTNELLNQGTTRMAQKVGEEGVEVSLAAATDDEENLKQEAADLIYHLLVLLVAKDISLSDICSVLENRHK